MTTALITEPNQSNRKIRKQKADEEVPPGHENTITLLFLANMSIPFIYSVMAAFFPIVAQERGLEQKHSGLVLGYFL